MLETKPFGENQNNHIENYSNMFYKIIMNYVTCEDSLYVSEKLGVPISEVERIMSSEESKLTYQKAKADLKKAGGDPFKLRLETLRLQVLDEMELTAFGDGDPKVKLDAQKTLLTMSNDLNKKEEKTDNVKSGTSIIFEIKKENK